MNYEHGKHDVMRGCARQTLQKLLCNLEILSCVRFYIKVETKAGRSFAIGLKASLKAKDNWRITGS